MSIQKHSKSKQLVKQESSESILMTPLNILTQCHCIDLKSSCFLPSLPQLVNRILVKCSKQTRVLMLGSLKIQGKINITRWCFTLRTRRMQMSSMRCTVAECLIISILRLSVSFLCSRFCSTHCLLKTISST